MLEEYAPSGVLAATYVRGIDLLFQDRSGARSFYATDNLGSTRALTNSAGAVTDTYLYDAYGNTIPGTGTTANPYLFTGQWFDLPIGQYYLRARYYNQSAGRFDSYDTFNGVTTAPLSLNHYIYVSADPTHYTDPTGHEEGLAVTLGGININFALGGLAAGISISILTFATYQIGALNGLRNLEFELQGLISSGVAEASAVYNAVANNTQAVTKAITDAINKAVAAGRGVASRLSKTPMFPVIRRLTPEIYAFDVRALSSNPAWFALTYNGPGNPKTAANRAIVLARWGFLTASAPSGYQLDEYPYASTLYGGAGALGMPVPGWQNALQGGFLSAFYKGALKGTGGRLFLVVPIPI